MSTYKIGDLQIIDDPIGLIRGNPGMFLKGVERANGQHLAALLLSDLIWSGALPARVNRLDQWWQITSATDWLVAQDGMGIDAFARIVPFPIAGPNSHHSENLLAAFADAVVTSGLDAGRKREERGRGAKISVAMTLVAFAKVGRMAGYVVELAQRAHSAS
jgi:hypothetical protein